MNVVIYFEIRDRIRIGSDFTFIVSFKVFYSTDLQLSVLGVSIIADL